MRRDHNAAVARADALTRRLIYLYIFLLFFEGALRKWVLPGLATPLLLIRDPVMVLIMLSHLNAGRQLLNVYTLPMLLLGVLSFLFSLAFAHGSILIASFGLRTLILHFPLIFIMGQVLRRRDVEDIGRYIVYLLPLVTVLTVLQFYSPQSAWVNRGVGGDMEGAGFGGADGYFRPPGIFSFTNGLVSFLGLAVTYIVYFWNSGRGRLPQLYLIVGTLCALAVIPFTISRAYLFQVLLAGAFFALASLRGGRSFRVLMGAIVALPLLFVILGSLGFVQTAFDVLTSRFEDASRIEGGLEGTLGDRFLGGLIRVFTHADQLPLFGLGLGLGTNVGAVLATGERTFLVGEGEWSRVVGEMGPLFGLPVVLLRIFLTLHVGIRSAQSLLTGNTLPFILLSFSFLQLLQAGWSQPTSLGFSVVAGGLTVAGFNRDA